MGKSKKKSFAELEQESYSKGAPDIHEDPVKLILGVIERNAKSISDTKLKYLNDNDAEQYGRYGDIEAAFDILKEDIRKEGFEL